MRPLDLDLSGLGTVRLLDATPRNRLAVERALGGLNLANATSEPLLSISFVDHLALTQPVEQIGSDAARSGNEFLVRSGGGRSMAWAALPLADAGRGMFITCERNSEFIPLLEALVAQRLLPLGVISLGAAACVRGGAALAAVGPSGSGKTKLLVTLLERGAAYLASQRAYVRADATLVGAQHPLRIRPRHLADDTALLTGVARGRATALAGGSMAASRVARRIGHSGRTVWHRRLLRIADYAARRAFIDVPVAELPVPVRRAAPLRTLVLLTTRIDGGVSAQRIESGVAAARLAGLLAYERRFLAARYAQFQFAFPERRNAAIEEADNLARHALAMLLTNVTCVEVRAPFSADGRTIANAIAAWI